MPKLTRRGFLAAAAASPTLAAAAPGAAAEAPHRAPERAELGCFRKHPGYGLRSFDVPRFRKAVKYGMVADGETVRDKFALVRELGFDGIELDSPNELDRDEVIAAREATGLVVHGVVDSAHWSKPFSHPDPEVRAEGVRALETALHDCHAYGGTTVLVVPGVVNKEVSYRDAWVRSRAEIAKVIPLAESLRIGIAFENVWNNFLLSPIEMARYIDDFASPMVGSYLDVGNLVRYAWPEHWVEMLGPRIMKIDVKAYSRKKQNEEGLWKGFGVPIGEGDCDWPAVMTALDKIRFHGWFTAEVGGGDAKRLRDIAERMDAIMQIPA